MWCSRMNFEVVGKFNFEVTELVSCMKSETLNCWCP
jgi:hypothetical protein